MMIRVLFVLASIINSDGEVQELLSMAPLLIEAGSMRQWLGSRDGLNGGLT